jgi:hypothetical protein
MFGAGGSFKALPALAIALLIGLVLAISQRTVGPSRAELAQALSKSGKDTVTASDVRSLRCDEFQTGGYACRWQQREDGAWFERSGQAQIDAAGWHVRAESGGRQ